MLCVNRGKTAKADNSQNADSGQIAEKTPKCGICSQNADHLGSDYSHFSQNVRQDTSTFLRGIQLSNRQGEAIFDTI
ncbi:unnamed protein product, partial [Didymodactylos carnosus]